MQRLSILDVPLTVGSFAEVCCTIRCRVQERRSTSICVRDAHGVVLCRSNPRLRLAHAEADMVLTDGVPLVWWARWSGCADAERVCGPDLLPHLCQELQDIQCRHFFYGGKPEIVQRLVDRLRHEAPGLIIAGCWSPPFRELTLAETGQAIATIRAAAPDIVWVGLGTPKQELWMLDTKAALPGTTLIGVGAAFDMVAGAVPRAPRLLQTSGLEWLYRAAMEPKRLLQRYAMVVPIFGWAMLRQVLIRNLSGRRAGK